MPTPQNVKGAFLITGPSGVGKTTITRKLHELGFNVEYAANICHFVDRNGREAAKPWDVTNVGWLSEHHFVFDKTKFTRIMNQHADDHIFIEAVASDMGNYRPLFKNILYLALEPDALAARIQADKRSNRFGKEDFQLQEILNGAKNLETWVIQSGGSKIDANKPVSEVVRAILETAS